MAENIFIKSKMKYLPIFLISLILLCAFGCGSKHQSDPKYDISDSIYMGEDNILVGYIANKDSVFEIVKDRIIQYINQNGIAIPEHSIEKYLLIDSLLHIIYDSKVSQVTTIDIEPDFAIAQHQVQFLNHYLLKEISKIATSELTKQLYKENTLIDSLISAQHRFLKTHIDNADYDGSCYSIKYYNTSLAVYRNRNESLRNLYFTMTDSNYHLDTQYRQLPNNLFEKEYAHILNELIPQKPIFEDKPLPRYNEKTDKEAVKMIRHAWHNFMEKRNEISYLLSGKQKNVWNNATYCFQRSHLIALKNEFEEMGVCGNEKAELLLSDTCTYEELLAYPNFTTKWNEHLKEFER